MMFKSFGKRLVVFVVSLLSVATLAYGLTVNGQLKKALLENLTSDPSGYEGRMFWDSDDNLFRIYNGASWQTMLTGDATAGAVNTADANTALLSSDRRTQLFNSFTVSRVITLPTTTIKAGEVWTLANSTAFDMVVESSDGDDLTIAVGANLDATVQKGYVQVMALQDTPTDRLHWRVLHVEEKGVVHSSKWTFNSTGSNRQTASSSDSQFSRVNDQITMSLQANVLLATTGAASTFLEIDTAIPVRFRVTASAVGFFQPVRTNSTVLTAGVLVTRSTGKFELYADAAGSAWTATVANSGFANATVDVVTYTYNRTSP